MSCVLNIFALYLACYRHGQSNPTFLIQTPNKSFVLRKKPPGSLLPGAHKVSVYVLLYLVINSNCLYGFKKRLNLWTLTQVAQVKQKFCHETLKFHLDFSLIHLRARDSRIGERYLCSDY